MNIAIKSQDMQRHQKKQEKQDIPSVNQLSDPILKCLKVSPNLFTPEKLNIFDTVILYTTLINCSQHIEQGERLNNLSWRIINKALLKDKSINKSKKRDGVKNLYYVLNPVHNKNNSNTSKNNTTSNSGNSSNISGENNVPDVFSTTISNINKSTNEEDTNSKEQPKAKKTTLNSTYNSSSGLFTLLGQRYQHHENFRTNNSQTNKVTNKINKNTYLHLNDNHKIRNDINSNGKHPIIVTGFDTNTLITKTKTIKANSGDNATDFSGDNSKYSKYNKKGNDNNNAPGLMRQKNSLFTYPSSKYNTGNNNNINDNNKKNQNHNSNRIFFSSEDEDEDEDDSDWNSLSSDEDAYDYDDYSDDDNHESSHKANKKDEFGHEDDEEDDDQYYKRQWNKLVFTKQSKLRATVSPSDSIPSSGDRSNEGLTPSTSNEQIVRKSLLSGLFSNEKSHHSNHSTLSPNSKLSSGQNSSTSSLHHHHHVLPTTSNISHLNKDTITAATTVTAHGSVTSAQGPMNAIVPLEEMMQRERRGRQMNRQLTTIPTESRKISRRDSYNSLFSEEDEEEENAFNGKEISRGRSNIHNNGNHDKQSNAPLTAQTILPTALSTHMFLPNSVIQQRRASRNGNIADETQQKTRSGQFKDQIGQTPITRRESIDIPIKNRGHLFLKTRMEISEEEKYIRRKHLGNAN
ncbi:Mks1p PWA37_002584 [Arxiozyma heterogenica]|uniref:Nitrogen regulatory protein areA GATA-like domain-containing protein n=1 Tax=Arxiozyma heterogenica TaxID=278026 RepID=A0AAN7WMF0_9SACH|nr:hypothetical protein RI543_002203 [Kazachstania heterogenica]